MILAALLLYELVRQVLTTRVVTGPEEASSVRERLLPQQTVNVYVDRADPEVLRQGQGPPIETVKVERVKSKVREADLGEACAKERPPKVWGHLTARGAGKARAGADYDGEDRGCRRKEEAGRGAMPQSKCLQVRRLDAEQGE